MADLTYYIAPSVVYKISLGRFFTANVYCDMATADGGWIVKKQDEIILLA